MALLLNSSLAGYQGAAWLAEYAAAKAASSRASRGVEIIGAGTKKMFTG